MSLATALREIAAILTREAAALEGITAPVEVKPPPTPTPTPTAPPPGEGPIVNQPFPGAFVLGSGRGYGQAYRQSVLTLSPAPLRFTMTVPPGWAGIFSIDLCPHPNEAAGSDAFLYVRVTGPDGVVSNETGTVRTWKGSWTGKVAPRKPRLAPGTYEVVMTTNKPCLTIFAVVES
jgi:hypothetical protein